MQELLIFSGTSEGRRLAEYFSGQELLVTVCVATEYGQEVMEESPYVTILVGYKNQSQIEALLREKSWRAVIDATHPFAREVTENIRSACQSCGREVLRLLRETNKEMEVEQKESPWIHYVNSPAEAVSYLNTVSGNIFFTTGSRDLETYVAGIEPISRIYARILPSAKEVEKCHKLGLTGRQIICMQGPFSQELNLAMLKETKASWLVTKETAGAGGFPEKIKAAALAGVPCIVIKRPKEQGYTLEQMLEKLGMESKEAKPFTQNKQGLGLTRESRPRIILAGVGMGNAQTITMEVKAACEDADVLIGARRILESMGGVSKPVKALYQSEEIVQYIMQNPQYQSIAVLLSGDVGFYSGARKLKVVLERERLDEKYEITQLCGISTVVYLASRLQIPWEDITLMSTHGRRQNVIGTLRTQEKVFVLTEGAKGVRDISRELLSYGYSHVTMYAASQLSYEKEEILQGAPEQFLEYDKEGLVSLLLINERAKSEVMAHGLSDEAFWRGKAPMTKEEVRSISISKLRLNRDSVVYDIGAGTGSISIECARLAVDGMVYAIEKNLKAQKLLEQNRYVHGAYNMEVIDGEAPGVMEPLPMPTHAFIGGSGGKLKEIAELLWKKNPGVRIVINIISMETVAEVMNLIRENQVTNQEILQVSVAKAKEAGSHHLMIGQNPVYVVTLQKEGCCVIQ